MKKTLRLWLSSGSHYERTCYSAGMDRGYDAGLSHRPMTKPIPSVFGGYGLSDGTHHHSWLTPSVTVSVQHKIPAQLSLVSHRRFPHHWADRLDWLIRRLSTGEALNSEVKDNGKFRVAFIVSLSHNQRRILVMHSMFGRTLAGPYKSETRPHAMQRLSCSFSSSFFSFRNLRRI